MQVVDSPCPNPHDSVLLHLYRTSSCLLGGMLTALLAMRLRSITELHERGWGVRVMLGAVRVKVRVRVYFEFGLGCECGFCQSSGTLHPWGMEAGCTWTTRPVAGLKLCSDACRSLRRGAAASSVAGCSRRRTPLPAAASRQKAHQSATVKFVVRWLVMKRVSRWTGIATASNIHICSCVATASTVADAPTAQPRLRGLTVRRPRRHGPGLRSSWVCSA